MFFFSSRRRHTRLQGDWSSDVCSSDLGRRIISTPDAVVNSTGAALDFLTSAPVGGAEDCCPQPTTIRNREIGRASCRERVEITGGNGAGKQNKTGDIRALK